MLWECRERARRDESAKNKIENTRENIEVSEFLLQIGSFVALNSRRTLNNYYKNILQIFYCWLWSKIPIYKDLCWKFWRSSNLLRGVQCLRNMDFSSLNVFWQTFSPASLANKSFLHILISGCIIFLPSLVAENFLKMWKRNWLLDQSRQQDGRILCERGCLEEDEKR